MQGERWICNRYLHPCNRERFFRFHLAQSPRRENVSDKLCNNKTGKFGKSNGIFSTKICLKIYIYIVAEPSKNLLYSCAIRAWPMLFFKKINSFLANFLSISFKYLVAVACYKEANCR